MPNMPLAIWTPGWMEIVIILAVLLLIFGRRLPDVMRNIGRGLTQFKRGMHDAVDDIKEGAASVEAPPPPEKTKSKSGKKSDA